MHIWLTLCSDPVVSGGTESLLSSLNGGAR